MARAWVVARRVAASDAVPEQADRDVRVADVDREQHGRMIRAVARTRAARPSGTHRTSAARTAAQRRSRCTRHDRFGRALVVLVAGLMPRPPARRRGADRPAVGRAVGDRAPSSAGSRGARTVRLARDVQPRARRRSPRTARRPADTPAPTAEPTRRPAPTRAPAAAPARQATSPSRDRGSRRPSSSATPRSSSRAASVAMRNGTYRRDDSVPGGLGLTPDELAVVVDPGDHILLRAKGADADRHLDAGVVPWATVDFPQAARWARRPRRRTFPGLARASGWLASPISAPETVRRLRWSSSTRL